MAPASNAESQSSLNGSKHSRPLLPAYCVRGLKSFEPFADSPELVDGVDDAEGWPEPEGHRDHLLPEGFRFKHVDHRLAYEELFREENGGERYFQQRGAKPR